MAEWELEMAAPEVVLPAVLVRFAAVEVVLAAVEVARIVASG